MAVSDQQRGIRKRLQALLQKLREQGTTQKEIANCEQLAPQYLSDVKAGRKPVTKLFAIRLGTCYGFDHNWLLHGGNPPEHLLEWGLNSDSPQLEFELSVFSAPIAGDFGLLANRDGTMIRLSGAAAQQADGAREPYVLRYAGTDHTGRLTAGDLILMTQEIDETARVQVVRHDGELCLARPIGRRKWRRVDDGKSLGPSAEPVGHCICIVWGPL